MSSDYKSHNKESDKENESRRKHDSRHSNSRHSRHDKHKEKPKSRSRSRSPISSAPSSEKKEEDKVPSRIQVILSRRAEAEKNSTPSWGKVNVSSTSVSTKIVGTTATQNTDVNAYTQAKRLFVGGLRFPTSETELLNFFTNAMTAAGFSEGKRSCVTCKIYHDKSFAFVDFLTPTMATNALTMDGIIFNTQPLKLRRPSDYVPVIEPPVTIVHSEPNTLHSSTIMPSRAILLKNMANMTDLYQESFYKELIEDIQSYCVTFGPIITVVIPKPSVLLLQGLQEALVFVLYGDINDAVKALNTLNGKSFDGRVVSACFFSEDKLRQQRYD